MLEYLRNTLKHTVIYSLGNLSTKIIGLILLPLYTSYLTTEEYGILSILEVTSQFFVALVGLGLSRGMMRWYAVEEDSKTRGVIVFTVFTALLFLSVFINIVFYPFNKAFSNLFFDHQDFSGYFMLLWMWVGLEVLTRVPFDLFRLKEKSLLFILLVILKFVSVLLLNIYFIVTLKMGVMGIILSQVLGNLLVMIGTLPFLLRNMRFSFRMRLFVEMSNFSVPLVVSTVATMALTLSDRYLIKYFLDYAEVGIYSLGYKVASVINLFLVQSFLLGFAPLAYRIFNQPEARRYFAKITTYFTLSMIILALVLIFYSKEVIAVFASSNQEYLLAYNVIPLLCLAVIFRGLFSVVSMGLHYTKKTKYTTYIAVFVAVFNIGINFILIPSFGIYGAALASILANLMMTLLFYIYSQRYYPINYEFGRLLKLFGIGFLLFFAANFTMNFGFWSGIFVKTLLLVLFPVLLYLIKFYEPVELNSLRGAWIKWRNPAGWTKNLRNFGAGSSLNKENKHE